MASGLGMGGASAEPPVSVWQQDSPEKVRSQVTEELTDKGSTDFWVRFADRPDMSQFSAIGDWDARGKAVYSALRDTATASQADTTATLSAQDVEYESFYITNAIRVSAGDGDLVARLAASPEVEGIYPTIEYDLPKVEDAEPVMAPSAVEWGIADINADDVWADFGVRGEGIIVGNIDSGVQYDHPALVEQYGGNNGNGTFSHDYHWFDAAGTAPDFPEDDNGHGSHVMGTMVGDDGGENQIGVAPEATWIAANGCCPSDAALIASGQWMLAPTDLEGENPDPTVRPHVINNSWGTLAPSNDPFMEDVSEAWAAAGQFGVWANGNSGPACQTSGSPGSRIINYSVGNYQQSHVISGSSGRGAGQDGEIKPNISAPGTAVRSSFPGSTYGTISGTSMASPHVAGAIALAWAAAPGLVGDVEVTRDLLDGIAIDTDDDQCGGTVEDNNVFGEGRLDALALLEAAPVGEAGTLEGTVTDANTGDPLEGASVEIEGPVERSLATGEDGSYSALLTAGSYDVDVEAFGYQADSATVTVVAEETVPLDFALAAADMATVSGTVTDGSGQDWPLYAAISLEGTPVAGYTDPETGAYSVDLPVGTTYTMVVESQVPGYTTFSEEVTISGDTTLDIDLVVDDVGCIAPGYAFDVDGVTESFDGTEIPEGWTVEDNAGSEQVWTFDDPGEQGNLTGGEGGFAVVDSDDYGPGGNQDTSLVSPPVDMTGLESPVVGFAQDLNYLSGETADVDVSIDGGQTWEDVVSWQEDLRGPRTDTLALPTAAGQTDVHVRFHYYGGSFDWWWQVDDVFIGNRACVPSTEGGLVVGNVYDENTGEGVVGARVTSLDDPDESATTMATPDDENLDDGFYWMFSSQVGEHPFEATARNYSSQTQNVDVAADDATRADFQLGAAAVEVDPAAIDTQVLLGESATEPMTVSNTGTGVAEIELSEVPGDFVLLRADGTTMTRAEITDAEGAPEIRREAETSVAANGGNDAAAQQPAPGPTEEPWTPLGPYPAVVMDNRTVVLDGTWYSIGGTNGTAAYDTVYAYDAEAMDWSEVAPLPAPLSAVTAGVVGGQIVVAGGFAGSGVSAATWAYDPGADAWSEVAESPVAGSAQGQAVLDGKLYAVGGCTTSACLPMSAAVTAYDPASDSWEQLADYPEAVAFASCAGLDGSVYCTGGNEGAAATSSSYAYDPGSDTWTEVAEAPIDTWASQYAGANGQLIVNGGVQGGAVSNATMAYDPAADAWSELPNSGEALYRGSGACGFARIGGSVSGFTPVDGTGLLPGFDACDAAGQDVPWLSLSETTATLQPGDSVTIDVTTDGDVAQPGTYSAGVRVASNAPSSAPEVPVTMDVDPPLSWGKLQGTVSGESCDGVTAPLEAAGIDISPTREQFPGWFLTTGEDGDYATWYDTRVGEAEVLATKDGYRPESAMVTVPRGETVTEDFALLDAECEVEPGPVNPEVLRLEGKTRYGTAAAISGFYEPGVDTVFVATGEDYPDALTAAALGGSIGAPILLTKPGSVPPEALTELGRLEPANVVILGGENAVSDDVEDAIDIHTGDATMDRWAGADRWETAALISGEFDSADVVYVATGRNYPDALAGAARAGVLDGPVLLVDTDEVPDVTRDELSRLSPDDIVLLGGDGAISDSVEMALGEYGTVERIDGETRFETAVEISQAYDTATSVFVASGRNWPDALAGAAQAGLQEAPVLLVEPAAIPEAVWEELGRLDPGTVYVLGGDGAVADTVADRLTTLE